MRRFAFSLCRLSLGTIAGILLFFPSAPTAAPSLSAPGAGALARASVGTHVICGVDIEVFDGAFFFSGFTSEPGWDFTTKVGLWVGATADRGSGPVTSVSTSAYATEFFSPDNPPPPLPAPAPAPDRPTDLRTTEIEVVAQDVFSASWLPDHVPLGIEVVQHSRPGKSLGGIHYVDVDYTIRNISDEAFPPGWTLQNVYLGVLADPDVGTDGVDFPWADDLGGFVARVASTHPTIPPGARRGDLAYVRDQSGNSDDVDTQFGLVLRGEPAHVFRIWFGAGEDPVNDEERYAYLRGNSDVSPTIGPDAVLAADQRILLSIGPVASLAPGETTTMSISLACGPLVPAEGAGAGREVGIAPVESRTPDFVVSRRAGRVRFPDLEAPIDVYSVEGRRVARVTSSDGWDLRGPSGGAVPAGIYFYRVERESAPRGKIVVTR